MTFFSKTSTLLLTCFLGFLALLFNCIAMSTNYWTSTNFSGSAEIYYTSNNYSDVFNRPLIKNRGLWKYCEFVYIPSVPAPTNATMLSEDKNANGNQGATVASVSSGSSPPPGMSYNGKGGGGSNGNISSNIQATSGGSTGDRTYSVCRKYNTSVYIPDTLPALCQAYYNVLSQLEKMSGICLCIAIGLQFFGVVSSFQATYTMSVTLFTDCGIMFLFGAIAVLLSTSLFIVTITYEYNEQPRQYIVFPNDYSVMYDYSFFLAWSSFILTSTAGTFYLLIARAFKMETLHEVPVDKNVRRDSTAANMRNKTKA
ncbi:uncharacterized protein LOC117115429 isoform X1 [Anneissia japonica]|uniref:uncharacterized protein LOC117115429 isoform X1 n=1 Tax=Anneissia japonica TaxID=1529436 RepID=UPI001425B635|nr:uncharacterized protein LOC117115429 isoform X1 [Anneissia japonica]